MASLIKWLDDPNLVVKFQNFFGVHPTPAPKMGSGDAHNGSVYCNGNCKHDSMNGSAKADDNMNCNGYSAVKHSDTSDKSVLSESSSDIFENGDVSTSSQNLRIRSKQEKYVSTTEESKNSAWDIVSNQERGMSDKWETEEYTIKNKFFYYLFNFGACLGNEIFYITFYPFWLWNIDSFVGRRVCIFWAIFMYLGQLTKDLLKIPRPPSPPVIRMEKLYALEYGMPSTHAMVGAGFPFSIILLTWQRYVVK